MIRSMTGFARCEHSAPFGTLAWEVRTVNHRYLEASLKLPEEFRGAEAEFRQTVANVVRRGKLDASLYFRPAVAGAATLELNEALLAQLIVRARDVGARLGSTALNPVELMRWPGVIREPERDSAPLAAAAHATLKTALTLLAETRASEGERIAAMLESRCQALEGQIEIVARRLPEVRTRIRTKLLDRLAALTTEPNRERLEQEIALLLTRMDVDEELDRLRSHITETRKALAGEEASGRRLDFLMQEFNREANTLSSKSQDVETTRAAVDMKVLIEQMREQVQNVE